MLFNSLAFMAFLPVTWLLYVLLRRNYKLQNILLLIASYVFYAWWDWRFVSLILFTTLVNFWLGLRIGAIADTTPENKRRRKQLLAASLIVSLGMLAFFKYFNFFIDSFISAFGAVGIQINPITLQIFLPVGISFFTFHALSYTIDVYRNELPATRSFINFAVFIAFFPQLVAGPIGRATQQLPQFDHPRRFTSEAFNSGIYLFIWGMFKKVVIADRLAQTANLVFNNYTDFHGLDLWIGVLAFTFQIYCDFSGYTDIARGVARFFGFELIVNFRLPYFAMNPSDFWNRWHISLSSWLRDYLYRSLGGNRKGELITYRNLFVTMLLGGLWHGAAWNFVIWGAYHGIILILYRRYEKRPVHDDPWSGQYPYGVVAFKWLFMFLLVVVGWLFFRASSLEQIAYMLTSFSPFVSEQTVSLLAQVAIPLIPLFIMGIWEYATNDLLILPNSRLALRIAVYTAMILGVFLFSIRQPTEFIYFQF